MKKQKDINDNLDSILGNENVLSVLLEFENMLDTVDLYAFKNWQMGEVVEGPTLERYWVTVSLMYPYKLMPDPQGAERLFGYGCTVEYKKIKYTRPVKIVNPSDMTTDEEGRRVPKMVSSPAWIITITMPRRYIDEGLYDSGSQEENFDQDAVEDAYGEGMDSEAMLKGKGTEDEEAPGGDEAATGQGAPQ